ncbi:MAG: UvrD-helicase domain-containing protein [Clostridiales Family XIII bacterium]|jgi:ATP-dependent helicase/nuclease subunit A|nr:UvrD-helicase domain-containing protein [Clostridiales Family XIII bacterium]
MNTNWTGAQLEAIARRDSNILVSAAAGSGKTAVLAERIKQLVLGDGKAPGTEVDRLLVVTFTEAAAAEMRRKIAAALEEEMRARGEDAYLARQLRRLPQASISTFHAFALQILRRYYYLIGLEPSFSVCDEFKRKLLVSEALDTQFEEAFESGDADFTAFLLRYAGARDEEKVRDMVSDVYDFVQSIPERFGWLKEKADFLTVNQNDFTDSAPYQAFAADVLAEWDAAVAMQARLTDVVSGEGVDSIAGKCAEDLRGLRALKDAYANEGHDACRDALAGFKYVTYRVKKDEKEAYEIIKPEVNAYRDRLKKRVKRLKEKVFARSLEALHTEIAETAPYAQTLVRLVLRYHEIFREKKKAEEVIDFNDIEHYALEILQSEAVRQEYREKFEYIFVDEYQDTNAVQETLIQAIARNNNMFMVGDVKQSIYRFRQADPDIFVCKYNEEFSDADDALSKRIDLNRNFRSKDGLIAGINAVFTALMDAPLSGIVYDARAALYPGLDYAQLGCPRELIHAPELVLVDTTGQEATETAGETFDAGDNDIVPEEIEVQAEDAGPEDVAGLAEDDPVALMRNAEIEAYAAAKVIQETLGAAGPAEQFFDAKSGAVRPYRKRDLVVLLREVRSSGLVFHDVLQRCGIEAYVDSGEGYFDRVEVETFVNLLRVLDNLRQDVPLVGSLYSRVLGFSIEELVRIRIAHRDGAFHEAFLSFVETGREGEADAALREKCAGALARIEGWRRREMFMELSDFLWFLLKDSGFYDYAGALTGGAQRLANLRALVDRAAVFQASGVRGLSGFIDFIDAIRQERIPIGQARMLSEADDVVRIMTIHKSKGLEFPMVILGQLAKTLDPPPGGDVRLACHKDVGLALTWEDPDAHIYRRTLLMQMAQEKKRREERAEALRVLYVAMTRAQDRLVMLATGRKLHARADGLSGSVTGLTADVHTAPTYIDMVLPVALANGFSVSRLTAAGVYAQASANNARAEQAEALLSALDAAAPGAHFAEISRRLSFEYPWESARRVKSKYSVTEIAKASREGGGAQALAQGPLPVYYLEGSEQEALHDAGLLVAEEKDPAALRGTALHKAFEKLDYAAALAGRDEAGFFEAYLDLLAEEGHLTMAARAGLDAGILATYAGTELFARAAAAAAAGKLFKETPFNFRTLYKGEEVLVQGIIDMWFAEADGIVLVDFKSGRFTPGLAADEARIRDAYGEQIRLYRQALASITGLPVFAAYIYMTDAGCTLEFR